MTTKEQEYVLKAKECDARAAFTEEGFLVKAGSLVRNEIVPSAKGYVVNIRQRLISEGKLESQNGQLRFNQDHLFKTPSGAAAVVMGRTANGWIEWKRADGKTLSEDKRVSRDERIPLLSEGQRQRILERYHKLLGEGLLPSQQQLDNQYKLFRERFGPDALAGWDGEKLLTMLHDHGNHDSLVYWLEFKNDEEFETRRFGSIAGGSALKFGIFRRKETGTWQIADKSNYPQDIPISEAIEIARRHRDQFLNGITLLNELSDKATDEDYVELQDQLDEQAPDVSRLAWGHKYFSLMFPNKLDDFHTPDWQRFHLLKLLQLPPEGDGRYVCAGRFVSVAREVGVSMDHLTGTLNSVNGDRHRYWRVGTTIGKTSFWPMMQEQSCVGVGWEKTGELSWVQSNQQSRERLKQLLEKVHPNHVSSVGRDCSQLTQFVVEFKEGDIVLAAEGMTIHGIGRVVGGYEYHPEFGLPHQRPVEWLSVEEWQMPESIEGLRSTVREIKKFDENILAIERRIQVAPSQVALDPIKIAPPPNPHIRLTGIPGRIQSILAFKGQVILYGPPGTGKTFWAERSANDLAAVSAFGKLFEALDDAEKTVITGHGQVSGLVRLCCFHPAYGYEDFLEGYRPQAIKGAISFELRDGVFKKLCKDAAAAPERNFYLVVDEINRGDIPRIFGELLTTLEKDKRWKRVILPISQEMFSVPQNVYLLGTMNTADRSISLLDAALRRRFGFVELMPDEMVFKDCVISGIPVQAWFEALNTAIRTHVGRDARNLQIGHSYLMQSGSPLKDVATLKRVIRDDLLPLLEEYCYEDYETLGRILGEQIVDVKLARIRHELFDDGREDDLVQSLLSPFPEISTSTAALISDKPQAEAVEDDEGDES